MHSHRFGRAHRFAAVILMGGIAACQDTDADETVRIDPPPAALGVDEQQQPTPGFDLLQQEVFRPGPAAPADVRGRATLMMPSAEAGMPDGMQVEARLEGLQPNVDYGWHLFMGRCDEEGSVMVGISPGAAGLSQGVATEAVGQPLRVGAGGIATQTALLPIAQITPDQLDLRAYSLRVYDGLAPEPARLVACADLGSTGQPATPR
jgi:hypothetical protein